MTNEMALTQQERPPTQIVGYNPREVVAQAKEQAEVLMEIVEDRKLYAVIDGKKYLEVDGWEIIGAFNRLRAETEWIREIESDGKIVGYEAHVQLIDSRTGMSQGKGTMSCGLDEFPCRGKEGMAARKACISAAQTWAVSKAYRMNYSWVAQLAGFEPTPADEMKQDRQPDTSSEYYCTKHKTEWFKRGRMPHYAHPIGDSNQWCNMPKQQKPKAKEPSHPDSPSDATGATEDNEITTGGSTAPEIPSAPSAVPPQGVLIGEDEVPPKRQAH